MKSRLQKHLFITLLGSVLITCIASRAVEAVVTMNGYWAASIIEGVNVPANGLEWQQQSPYYNPDVFCEMQGPGWRVPRAVEVNKAYAGFPPLSGNMNISPATRTAVGVGALYNEWALILNKYNPNWTPRFWVYEPNLADRRRVADESGYINAQVPTFNIQVVCAISL